MKKLFLLATLFMVSTLFAQQATNTLEGVFTTKAKDELYNPFKFDGKGKVTINEFGEDGYEFFERNDSVVIFVEKTVFIFKKEKNQLKGISDWVDKKVYKSNLKSLENKRQTDSKLAQRANWMAQNYDINFKNNATFLFDLDENSLIQKLKENEAANAKLCKEGFDESCKVVFAYKFAEESGGVFETLNAADELKLKPNKELEQLAQRVIDLGNPDGYGLFYTYYYFTGEKEKAEQFLQKGLDLGSPYCNEISINSAMSEFGESLQSEIEDSED
ncbi:hypothetical protein F0358_10360 [Empedobacter brevis]|uniref:hypothetical protein n=1 Tax=Empedobacter brevis TaxID=247 RepID=UPI00123DE9A6|nr:hypothetical protein [Empedobacter brevis]QES93083.1 hypothetical protein F0358_10360 [Empedobacter brevis]